MPEPSPEIDAAIQAVVREITMTLQEAPDRGRVIPRHMDELVALLGHEGATLQVLAIRQALMAPRQVLAVKTYGVLTPHQVRAYLAVLDSYKQDLWNVLHAPGWEQSTLPLDGADDEAEPLDGWLKGLEEPEEADHEAA